MSDQRDSPELKRVLDDMLLGLPDVKPGRIFGWHAYKVGGKVFATYGDEGVAVKVGKNAVAALLERPGNTPFSPAANGNMWVDWIMMQRDNPDDFGEDMDVFIAAHEFTGGM